MDEFIDHLAITYMSNHPCHPHTGLGGIAYVALRTALLLLHRRQQHPSPLHPPALTTPLQRLHSDEESADVRWVRRQEPNDYLGLAHRYLTAAEAALERAERRGHRRDVTFIMGGPGALRVWMVGRRTFFPLHPTMSRIRSVHRSPTPD
jgi:hypothetical protein